MSGQRPRLLDLFCCQGGAAVGYHRAGFDVVGVDITPQPRYPFEFHQADALAMVQDRLQGCWHESYHKSSLPGMLPACLGHFDAIHASPPCQHSAAITKGTNRHRQHLHPNLYPATKAILEASGLPYVIENPDARPDAVLCGEMFGLGVLRHRRFESNVPITAPQDPPHRGRVRGWRHGVYYDGPYVAVYGSGGGKASLAEAGAAMGIDWMDYGGLRESIPPAFTEFIGEQLLAHLAERAA